MFLTVVFLSQFAFYNLVWFVGYYWNKKAEDEAIDRDQERRFRSMAKELASLAHFSSYMNAGDNLEKRFLKKLHEWKDCCYNALDDPDLDRQLLLAVGRDLHIETQHDMHTCANIEHRYQQMRYRDGERRDDPDVKMPEGPWREEGRKYPCISKLELKQDKFNWEQKRKRETPILISVIPTPTHNGAHIGA